MSQIVKLRVPDAEKSDWQARAEAAGLSLSDLIRQAMGRVRTWTAGDRSAYRERTREIARIGSNLNQVARWANRYGSHADAAEIALALERIEDALGELDAD